MPQMVRVEPKWHVTADLMRCLYYHLEIKKIILAELQGHEYPASKIIEDILCHLMALSSSPYPDSNIMKSASQYILAYLQLGFSYLEHQALFDKILQRTYIAPEQMAPLQL